MSKPEELRQLADKFSEGWHEGIKIDAMDVMLLSDVASELETLQATLTKTQPATGEPVASRNPFASRCYTMSESHLSGHRLIVGFEKLGDVQDAHEWVARQGCGDFTHPATGEPVGQVSDLFPSVRNKLHAKGFDSDAPLYTHPVMSVPGDVMRDAERYRWLRNEANFAARVAPQVCMLDCLTAQASALHAEAVDEAIDAAMLAGKTGGAA